MRLRFFALACLVALTMVSAVSAAKPGDGSSTGTGTVFVSNPVQSLGNESLTDQKDSDAAVPAAAYYKVVLRDLDGSGFLRGKWANVEVDRKSTRLNSSHTAIS